MQLEIWNCHYAVFLWMLTQQRVVWIQSMNSYAMKGFAVRTQTMRCSACHCYLSSQLQGENTWDFFTPSVVASFPALGNLSKAVVLGVSDDDIPEADETFTFYLAAQVNQQQQPHTHTKKTALKQLSPRPFFVPRKKKSLSRRGWKSRERKSWHFCGF